MAFIGAKKESIETLNFHLCLYGFRFQVFKVSGDLVSDRF